jgi:preprotein translocase subunit SecY
MLATFLNIFRIPELRNKLMFTFGMLAIYRIGYYVPMPGVDQGAMLASRPARGGGLASLIDTFELFTGGNLSQSNFRSASCRIFRRRLFPRFWRCDSFPEKAPAEGESGRRKIQEYTRYATVALCIINAIVWMRYLASSNFIYTDFMGGWIGLTFNYMTLSLLMLTTGTLFLMWLGEQIDEYGMGNGISLIIMAGIVARIPNAMIYVLQNINVRGASVSGQMDIPKILFLVVMFVSVVAGAILITQGQRRIPIQQAKQTRGRRVYGGQRHYLPLRVNHGGVMPIIFASSMLIFPGVIFGAIRNVWDNGFWRFLESAFQGGTYPYTVVEIAAIFFFAYFWTTVQFRPKEMANNLRDYGSFIPGLRPGKRTADYLEKVMGRITYVGAGFLALIAIIPTLVATSLQIPFIVSAFLGGTGLLIVVSVTLDMVQRIEANLIMRNYKGFLGDVGPIKGSRT